MALCSMENEHARGSLRGGGCRSTLTLVHRGASAADLLWLAEGSRLWNAMKLRGCLRSVLRARPCVAEETRDSLREMGHRLWGALESIWSTQCNLEEQRRT